MGALTSCGYVRDFEYDSYALQLHRAALQWRPCLLPDVGIDSSLLKYSGIDSNAALQSYSDDLVNKVPDYVDSLGSAFGSFTSFPNAVGLGALVISMIIEICMKSSTGTTDDPYSMIRRVFGEEKASGVRDTVSEYVKRHEMYMNNERLLQMEIQRLEKQLSNHLTVLRNSLLHDGQMTSRGFKIWVNGASFHVQMLIHEARLNTQTRITATDYVHTIQRTITTYLRDLDNLLEEYKTHMTSTENITFYVKCYLVDCTCVMKNIVTKDCSLYEYERPCKRACNSCVKGHFLNHVFSKYEPLSGLKSHFLNIKNNLNDHINQHDSFTLPSAR